MVDMVGEDLSLDPKRIAGLTRQVRETMPHAADYDADLAVGGPAPGHARQRPDHRRHAVSEPVAERRPGPARLHLRLRLRQPAGRLRQRQGAAVPAGRPDAALIWKRRVWSRWRTGGDASHCAAGARPVSPHHPAPKWRIMPDYPPRSHHASTSKPPPVPAAAPPSPPAAAPSSTAPRCRQTAEALMRSRYTAYTPAQRSLPARHLASAAPCRPARSSTPTKSASGSDLR